MTAHTTTPATDNNFISEVRRQPIIILAFALMLILAGGLRLATYDRYLPFIDYTDEGVYMALAQEMRGLSSEEFLREKYGEQVSFRIYNHFSALVQVIYTQFQTNDWNVPANYYVMMRQISSVMGVLTAVFIAGAGWYLGNWLSGWLAGMVWAASPIVVEYNMLAIPDPPVYLLIALVLFAVLHGWHSRSMSWLFIGLVAAILVIYSKFWILTIVIPVVGVALWVLWLRYRTGQPWRLGYGMMFVTALITGLYFILVMNPADNGGEKVGTFSFQELLARFWDTNRIANNWHHALYPIAYESTWATLILLGGVVSLVIAWRMKIRTVRIRYVAVLVVYALFTLPLTASISNVTADGRMRHIYPLTIALLPLFGAAIIQIIWLVQHFAKRISPNPMLQRGILLIGVLVPILWAAPQYIERNTELIERFERIHVVDVLRGWFDGSPPRDGRVMQPQPSDLDRTWNRIWGAYAGNKPFEWWDEQPENIIGSTPQSFVDRGITYFILNDLDLSGKYGSDGVRAFLDDAYLVKSIPVDPDMMAGYSTYVWRLARPQVEFSFDYSDEINLIAYDLSTQTITAGDTLFFRPYWTIDRQPTTNYSMFLHLYRSDDTEILSQSDGALLPASERLTLTWTDLDEIYFGDYAALPIPTDLPPGEYRLAIGVYDFTTFARLSDPMSGMDFASIPITVTD